MRLPAKITDSTSGAVSASYTIDDTTASVKDDAATVANVINQILDAIRNLTKRLEAIENA